MELKVKAVERLLKFDKESAGVYRYDRSFSSIVVFCTFIPMFL